MGRKFGIDISHWQKGLDIAATGAEFAILKIGGRGNNNKCHVDECVDDFVKQCENAGIPYGFYWYTKAIDIAEATEECEFLVNLLLNYRPEYPIYIDAEDQRMMQGVNTITSILCYMCNYLLARGYYPGVYTNMDWYTHRINPSDLEDFDIWIASWGNVEPIMSQHKMTMWQFGGSVNKIRDCKIQGMTVDQDYCYVDYPSIIKNTMCDDLCIFTHAADAADLIAQMEKITSDLVAATLAGWFGNGTERKNALGEFYALVQNRINRGDY